MRRLAGQLCVHLLEHLLSHGLSQQIQEHANVRHHAHGLPGAAIADLGGYGGVDIHAHDLHPAWQHVAGGYGVQHGPQAQYETGALKLLGVGVLGGVHVGDGIGQRTIVAQAAGQHEGHVRAHAFVEDAAGQASRHRPPGARRPHDRWR